MAVGVVVVIVGLGIFATGGVLNAFLVSLAALAVISCGALLAESAGHMAFAILVSGTVALLLGYAVARTVTPGRRTASQGQRTLSGRGEPFAVGVLLTLTLVHFVRAGVPLFQASVEQARFEFGASGMFGIPARAYQMGLPLAILYIAARRHPTDSTSLHMRLLWGGFLASRLLGGFKSGALQILFLLIVTAGLKVRLRIPGNAARILALAGFAAIFAVAVGSLYQSNRSSTDDRDPVQLVIERATYGAAEGSIASTSYSRERNGFAGSYGTILVSDYATYLSRLVPIFQERNAPEFKEQVWEELSGLSSAGRDFVPPVTIALPVVAFEHAGLLYLPLMALIGTSSWALERRTRSHAFQTRWHAAVLQLLLIYLTIRGDIAYITTTYAVSALAVWLLFSVSRSVASLNASHHGVRLDRPITTTAYRAHA